MEILYSNEKNNNKALWIMKKHFSISEEEFDEFTEKYSDIPFVKNKFNEKRKQAFCNDAVIFYNWFKEQKNCCGYCGITQNELYELFSENLPLNDKTKRSSGTLEIERLDSDKDYSEENLILACPLCNNSKSNLIDESSWREIFVEPMRGYYEKLLGKELVNLKPQNKK